MKLYATVTSERASKGQGGNEFLHITIRDERETPLYFLGYWPNGTIVLEDIRKGVELYRKGEKQKDVCETQGCTNEREENYAKCAHHIKQGLEKLGL